MCFIACQVSSCFNRFSIVGWLAPLLCSERVLSATVVGCQCPPSTVLDLRPQPNRSSAKKIEKPFQRLRDRFGAVKKVGRLSRSLMQALAADSLFAIGKYAVLTVCPSAFRNPQCCLFLHSSHGLAELQAGRVMGIRRTYPPCHNVIRGGLMSARGGS